MCWIRLDVFGVLGFEFDEFFGNFCSLFFKHVSKHIDVFNYDIPTSLMVLI